MPIIEWNFPTIGKSLPHAVLATRGPLINVTVTPLMTPPSTIPGQAPIAPTTGVALVDTGAAFTSVDETVCRNLGLVPSGSIPLAHAGGSGMHFCYPVEFSFPGTVFPSFQQPMAVSVNLQAMAPIIVLFGRDLLSMCKFTYNGIQGRFEIAF